MPRGPKPKPLHLKLIQGTDNVTRTNYAEPYADGEIGDAPHEMTPERRLLWGILLRDAPQFVLKSADREAFRSMINTVAVMREAERMLCGDMKPLVVKTKQGNVINNPYLGIYNTAVKNFMRIAAELGYTPAARTRIVSGHGSEENAIERAYLR
jgi:P27 family predicted phage terminase small subunit